MGGNDMIFPEVLDAMVAAGASAEIIVAAVKADYYAELDKIQKDSCGEQLQTSKEKVSHTLPKENIYIKPSLSPKTGTNPRSQGTNPRNQTVETTALLGNFEIFWGFYPRRQAKGGALRAFRSAVKRAKFEDILAGVKRYAAERKGEDRRYTALPTTWLNQDRWLDEGEKPASKLLPAPPKRTWAEIKAEREAIKSSPNVVQFPGVSAPIEGEDLDALVRSNDQSQEGITGAEELGIPRLPDVLPALQAMDNSEKDQT